MKGLPSKFSKCLIGCLALCLMSLITFLQAGASLFGYSKCEGDKRWDNPKATGVSRGSSNSGQDSFLFLQTHLWFLSRSLNYRLPVSQPRLGSLQKALIVLQYITVLQSLKKKKLVGDWHETSKLILSAAWKGLWATVLGGEKLMFWLPLPAVSPVPWQRGCSLTLLQSDLILLKIFFWSHNNKNVLVSLCPWNSTPVNSHSCLLQRKQQLPTSMKCRSQTYRLPGRGSLTRMHWGRWCWRYFTLLLIFPVFRLISQWMLLCLKWTTRRSYYIAQGTLPNIMWQPEREGSLRERMDTCICVA